MFAWRVFARDRDLSPARHFWRGYRLDVLDVLRWWVPTLGVLGIIAVNLTHLGAAGLPPVLGVALGAVALLVVLWSGHALVLSALFSFRTRDVARLGAYFVAGKPLVTLGFVSILVLIAALAYVSDWLVVLLAAPLTLPLRAHRGAGRGGRGGAVHRLISRCGGVRSGRSWAPGR